MSAVSHAARAPAWIRALSAKTLGVLAVVGLVVAFSLSSTLVKRAETAGVLVAFWRLAVGEPRVERRPVEHGSSRDAARRARGVDPRRLLRAEPGGVLRRGDAQQRRERGPDRVVRAVPDRARRGLALPRVHRPARAGVRGARVRGRGARASECAARRRRLAGGERLRGARDAAAGGLRRLDEVLPRARWT